MKDLADVGFAVLFLPGKVAQCLFPETTLLVPVTLTGFNHFSIFLILHVVVHYLLVPATTYHVYAQFSLLSDFMHLNYALPCPITQRNPYEVLLRALSAWCHKETRKDDLCGFYLQFALLVKVKDAFFEVVHLAEHQSFIKHSVIAPQ